MSIPITVSTALALVLALPFWLAGPAQAVPVSFAFSGALDRVNPELSSIFVADGTQKFEGNFTYESLTLPSAVGQGFAAYNAVTAFQAQVHVGPSSFSPQKITFTTIFSTPSAPNVACAATGATCSVQIFNDPSGGGSDQFRVQQNAATGFIGSKGSVVGGSGPLEAVGLVLIDHSASVFNAVSPLPTSLDLSRFDVDERSFVLQFANPENPALPFLASGALDKLDVVQQFPQFLLIDELAAVPEPATLLLLGSTMAGLGLAARWRRRRQG